MGRALVALRRRAWQGSDQILDQRLGIERLSRGIGGADGFAAAALDAGIEADQPIPGEVDFPGIADGVIGMAFIEAAVKSSAAGAVWIRPEFV